MLVRRATGPLASAFFVLVACGDGGSGLPPLDPIDASSSDASAADTGVSDATDVDAKGDAATPDASAGCGEFTGDTRFTCSKDGMRRGKCVSGVPAIETCSRGCLREKAPADDVCMGTTATFSCSGSWGTKKAENGDYYLTAFGCWVDANKQVHTDPGDNCIPYCLTQAQQSGLCKSMTGPQCEENVNWYVADEGRFGCLARLLVSNPKNGKKAVVVVLDAGPGCSVENAANHAVLDASGRLNEYLFGAQMGYSDKALVHVVEVDPSTPLGPM